MSSNRVFTHRMRRNRRENALRVGEGGRLRALPHRMREGRRMIAMGLDFLCDVHQVLFFHFVCVAMVREKGE